MSGRPENQLPAEFFYNDIEAKKYTNCTRIIQIQSQMANRAIELLNLQEENCLILDIGCGSGLSGQELSEQDHTWVGLDISKDMLEVAQERGTDGDMYAYDMGQGFKFRPGVFDAAISISALQWLCVASKKSYNPWKRLNKFFTSLYNALKSGGRAVLQFYPENSTQLDMITKSALKSGFCGGLIIDYPNSSKNKKCYLALDAGGTGELDIVMLEGLQDEDDVAKFNSLKNKQISNTKTKKITKKSKEWIQKKKDLARKKGNKTQHDSKFTGRNRNNLGMFG